MGLCCFIFHVNLYYISHIARENRHQHHKYVILLNEHIIQITETYYKYYIGRGTYTYNI